MFEQNKFVTNLLKKDPALPTMYTSLKSFYENGNIYITRRGEGVFVSNRDAMDESRWIRINIGDSDIMYTFTHLLDDVEIYSLQTIVERLRVIINSAYSDNLEMMYSLRDEGYDMLVRFPDDKIIIVRNDGEFSILEQENVYAQFLVEYPFAQMIPIDSVIKDLNDYLKESSDEMKETSKGYIHSLNMVVDEKSGSEYPTLESIMSALYSITDDLKDIDDIPVIFDENVDSDQYNIITLTIDDNGEPIVAFTRDEPEYETLLLLSYDAPFGAASCISKIISSDVFLRITEDVTIHSTIKPDMVVDGTVKLVKYNDGHYCILVG